jgi:nitrate/TMAO reductase-like tetraheme cytochrome c subunit
LTRTAWFERKHLRKLPASVWADPKVKSAANCQACHTRADKSSFSETEVEVPGFPGKHW